MGPLRIIFIRKLIKRDQNEVPLLERSSELRHTGRLSHKVRVTSEIELQPQRQTYVTVKITLLGVIEIQSHDLLYEKHNLVTMYGIVQVRQNIQFRILISKYSRNAYVIFKKQVVEHLDTQKSGAMPTKIILNEILGITE